MTDRALLKLAAKAVGFHYNRTIVGEGLFGCFSDAEEQVLQSWNPIRDDADALDVVVRLGLNLTVDRHNRRVVCNTFEEFYDESKFGGSCDPYAATRRAIVLAAAEIGKVMS